MSQDERILITGLGIMVSGIIYFIPTFVAARRNHSNVTSIFLLNLLLGWVIIGWIGALIWSASDNKIPKPEPEPVKAKWLEPKPDPTPKPPADDTKDCPFCAETIKAKAVVCRFCGKDLTQELKS